MPDLLPRLPRVEALIGRRMAEIDAATLERMVATPVREDTDIDFKIEPYEESDRGHRDAAGDVAAMANGPGGAIFVGIQDVDGAASEIVPVAFSEVTELRLRQAVISLTAPAPTFPIRRIPFGGQPDRGVYLIVVPPSPYAPHAVRSGNRLAYPRRSGPHTRWLSESEVADAYRTRFITSEQRGERLQQVQNAGEAALHHRHQIWLTTTLVPTVPGSFPVRRRSMVELAHFSLGWHRQQYGSHVFRGYTEAEAGVGRVIVFTRRDPSGRFSTAGHAELHTDGSAFAATEVGVTEAEPPLAYIDDELLVEAALSTSGLCLALATDRAGVFGDVLLSLRIDSMNASQLILSHTRNFGGRSEFERAHPVSGHLVSTHLVNLDDAGTSQGRLIVARMLLTEVFQWFGYPEVPQITETGQLRRPYIAARNRPPTEAWAASNAVEIIDSTLEVEP